MDGYRRLHVDEVRVTGISSKREVIAVRKKWIESLQDIPVRIFIPRGGVELNSEPWCPPDICKCVARERADRPRADRVVANAAALTHDFEVAVESVDLGGETRVNAVATLVATYAQVLCVI